MLVCRGELLVYVGCVLRVEDSLWCVEGLRGVHSSLWGEGWRG